MRMENSESATNVNQKRRMAIFLDAENITGWVKHRGLNNFFREYRNDYSVSIRKAYADWSNSCTHAHQVHLNIHGFDFVHCVHPVSGKNSADIQMSIDIIECALTMPDIDCFVIATRDSDFSPVFRWLRNHQKDIIAVCDARSALARSVRTSCLKIIDASQAYIDRQMASPFYRLRGMQENDVAEQEKISVDQQKDSNEITPLKTLKTASLVMPVEPESMDKRYQAALKKHDFYLLSINKIKLIYKESITLRHTQHETVDDLKARISESIHEKNPMITDVDVERLFKFFDVMEYIETKPGRDKKNCVLIKKLPVSEFMVELDKAVITILLQLKEEFNFEVKAPDFKKISVSSLSLKEVSDFIEIEAFRLEFHASTNDIKDDEKVVA